MVSCKSAFGSTGMTQEGWSPLTNDGTLSAADIRKGLQMVDEEPICEGWSRGE